MNDEFYIGWEDKAPPAIHRKARLVVMALLLVGMVLGLVFALAQRTIGAGRFEWGKVRSFVGVFQSRPYPHLLVSRPGARAGESDVSSYYLVKPFKFGVDADVANAFDGKAVSLKGTLIHRGNQTMIEVADESIRATQEVLRPASSRENASGALIAPVELGRQTLVGEIVDSKCYLGVMNPGALIPHRACAIRCISGGIPPVLLVRRPNGEALYFLLVSPEGKPVNKQVLDLVAEPVRITGEAERQGELLVLRAAPATIRRVD